MAFFHQPTAIAAVAAVKFMPCIVHYVRLKYISAVHLVCVLFQTLFEEVIKTVENGGKAARVTTTVGYSKEQAEAIQRLVNAKDNYERLGLHYGASRYELNMI